LSWSRLQFCAISQGVTTTIAGYRIRALRKACCLCRCAYTNWTTTATGCDDFFTDPNAIQLYKNHIRTILTRVNSVTGIPYGSDPTIMGKWTYTLHTHRKFFQRYEIAVLCTCMSLPEITAW